MLTQISGRCVMPGVGDPLAVGARDAGYSAGARTSFYYADEVGQKRIDSGVAYGGFLMDATKREILGLLVEDFYSPWEIALQVPVGRGVLTRTIARLLADGLAAWYARVSDSALAVAVAELPTSVPDLGDDATWVAADLDAPQLLIGITPEGEVAYYQH
jgi:hypothetical protein